jgi:hypothetical protein
MRHGVGPKNAPLQILATGPVFPSLGAHFRQKQAKQRRRKEAKDRRGRYLTAFPSINVMSKERPKKNARTSRKRRPGKATGRATP